MVTSAEITELDNASVHFWLQRFVLEVRLYYYEANQLSFHEWSLSVQESK